MSWDVIQADQRHGHVSAILAADIPTWEQAEALRDSIPLDGAPMYSGRITVKHGEWPVGSFYKRMEVKNG